MSLHTGLVRAQQWFGKAVQAQADARSEETEEAYEQAALLDGALAAAEATQADLAQQVHSHVQPCVLSSPLRVQTWALQHTVGRHTLDRLLGRAVLCLIQIKPPSLTCSVFLPNAGGSHHGGSSGAGLRHGGGSR